ncbi:MAG: hypothetical protein M3299_04770 [Thermoproteota archaeon]|nr:hypothetical protein [Thermoproteota archaeon]
MQLSRLIIQRMWQLYHSKEDHFVVNAHPSVKRPINVMLIMYIQGCNLLSSVLITFVLAMNVSDVASLSHWNREYDYPASQLCIV